MHLRGRTKHIALRVCFIQKLIQDGILNDSLIRPFLSHVCWPSSFHLVCVGRLLYIHVFVLLCVCILVVSVLVTYGQERGMRIAVAL